VLVRRIETNKLPENENYSDIGGLDTPLLENSGLLDHRNLIETKNCQMTNVSSQEIGHGV
jgi:hypothetical protein